MKLRSTLGALLVAVVAAAAGLVCLAADPLPGVELRTVDARFDVRGAQPPPSDVVIVGLDQRAIDVEGKFPIDRERHANVIRALTEAGAKVIAFDVQFTEPGPDEKSDEALFEAVHDAPSTVFATTEVGDGGETQIFSWGKGLQYTGATPAASSVPADDDGRVRWVPFEEKGLTSFAIATAQAAREGKLELPAGDAARIDFVGDAGAIPEISFADVEDGTFAPESVRGKVVLVGATAPQLQDFLQTATSDEMAGVEVQASAVATALAGFGLHDAADWIGWLSIIVLAIVPPLVARRLGALFAALSGVLVALAFLVFAQVAFNAGSVVPVVPPLVAAGLALAFAPLIAAPAPVRLGQLLERLGPSGANRRSRQIRTLLLLSAAAGIALIGIGAQATNVLRRLDLGTVNTRFAIRGEKPAPPVVVVTIEDKTITKEGGTWPMNRTRHAKVIENLHQAGAKVIAYDVQFTEPSGDTEEDAEADNALIEAVRAAYPRMVMATTEVEEGGRTAIFGGGEGLVYSRAIPANSNYLNDPDGKIRHTGFKLQDLKTFPIAAAEKYLGRAPALPAGDSAWIDYPGPPESIPYISFDDVETNTFDKEAVRGKLVVVGATAPSLQDRHLTSTTTSITMPGPEIQAASAGTAIEGFPLSSGARWIDYALVVLLAALAPLAALRLRIFAAVAVGVVGIAAVLVAAQLAFNGGTIITVTYAVIAGILAIIATGAIHGLTVAFEREQARDAFARFVPEAVVDQVLADADGVRLGGVRREGTVMFSDLRGFTSFSETLEPERVIDSLNRYLTLMSEAILDHGGTLVAYMGDGIMAVFGAPLMQDDHADRALEASRAMLARMDDFNGWLRSQGLHDGFKMGIGLNSGPVMSGNVGSERRLEYTALGDTTNTAARLEGMTKGTPHQLFLSDSTKQMLTRPAPDLVQVGEADVRGRTAKVLLWSISDEEPTPEPTPSPERVEA
jgi:adenylate cyclase